MLKESGEKVQAADKTEVEAALAEARKALEGTNAAEMRAAHETLTKASHKLAEALYKANAAGPAAGQGAPSAQADGTPGDGHPTCPGHSNATGLRLYYDSVNRPSNVGGGVI